MTTAIAEKGVDAHDSAGIASHARQLAAQGYDFVAQYIGLSPGREDGGSAITPAQAQSDLDAGLDIVSIFETNGMTSTVFKTGTATYKWESYLTKAQGEKDAADAVQAAKALGQPAGTTVYFAMDFDPAATDGKITETQALNRVDNYFRGVDAYMASLGSGQGYDVGVYGAGDTLQSVSTHDLASYTWLSESSGWAGYGIDKSEGPTHGWSMIQSASNPVDGVEVDKDKTVSTDFGAWGASPSASPAAAMTQAMAAFDPPAAGSAALAWSVAPEPLLMASGDLHAKLHAAPI